MNGDRNDSAALAAVEAPEPRKAQSNLYVYDKPIEQDGVYVFASIECAEIMPGTAYLALDCRTGMVSLSVGCGCASTINIGTMLLSLAAQQAIKHMAATPVH